MRRSRLVVLPLLCVVQLSACSFSKRSTVVPAASVAPGKTLPLGTPAPRPGDYTFDAIALTPEATARSYKLREEARIVVKNVNPFLFKYTIDVTANAIPEANPSRFFGSIGSLGFTVPALKSDSAMGVTGVTDTSTCGGNARLLEMEAKSRSALAALTQVEVVRSNLRVEWTHATAVMYDATRPVAAVAEKAESISVKLLAAAKAISDRRATMQIALESFRAMAGALEGAIANCSDAEKKAILGRRDGLARDTTILHREVYQAIPQQAGTLGSAGDLLQRTARDPAQFYRTKLLDTYHSPHDVTVRITRVMQPLVTLDFNAAAASPAAQTTPAAPAPAPATQTTSGTVTVSTTTVVTQGEQKKEEKAASSEGSSTATAPTGNTIFETRINIGGPGRFVIGAGFLGAQIRDREYSVVPSVSADATTFVIGPPAVSEVRVMPVLTLNAQMFSYRSTSFLLTMGAGSRTANSLEYLFGVSGAAFDQRIITTVGGFVGPTTVLAGGAHVGDVIATNTVPTAKRTVLAFGIAMSARLLPWSSPEK